MNMVYCLSFRVPPPIPTSVPQGLAPSLFKSWICPCWMLCRLHWICFYCCPTSALWTASFSGFQTSWSMYHIHFPASSKTIFMTKLGQNDCSNNNFRELHNSVHKLSTNGDLLCFSSVAVFHICQSNQLSQLSPVCFVYRIPNSLLSSCNCLPTCTQECSLYSYYFLATLQ